MTQIHDKFYCGTNFLCASFCSTNFQTSPHVISCLRGLFGNISSITANMYYVDENFILHCVSKKCPTLYLSISLTNISQFSKFFHSHTLSTICNKSVIEYPTTP